MANIDVTLNPDLLPNLLTDEGEGLKKLVESVLNQVLEGPDDGPSGGRPS